MTDRAHQDSIGDPWSEFPPGAFDAPTGLRRREFLRLMAASLALAEAAGCSRLPPEQIVPTTHNQEQFIPGVPAWYATSVTRSGYGMGVLARSDDGRPTKIEGNPDHPASLGATDAITQAELLTLYDPARSSTVRRRGVISDWSELEDSLDRSVEALEASGGEGLHVVVPPITSPTALAMIDRARERLPRAEWYRHDTLDSGAEAAGVKLATGRELDPVYDLSRARVVVGLDSDVFGATARGVHHSHGFGISRRRLIEAGGEMVGLLVAEPAPTASGARADFRLAARRGDIGAIAGAIAEGMGMGVSAPALPPASEKWLGRAVAALRGARGESLVMAGPAQPPEVHALAMGINAALGNEGRTVRFIEPVERMRGGLRSFAECIDALEADGVDTIMFLGINPVYDAVARERLIRVLPRARFSLHLGLYNDETASICQWHAPMAHDLERWGDARAFDGTAGIIQPLTEPIHGGRSMLHVLARLALADTIATDRELVEEYWRKQVGAGEWEGWRRSTLRAGVVAGSASPSVSVGPMKNAVSLPAAASESAIELSIDPHPALLDGRYAPNAWLQEMPEQITQLTWGSAAVVSTALAGLLGVESGDVVKIRAQGREIEVPMLVLPGVAPGTIGLKLGHGRTKGGDVAVGRGVDVGAVRSAASPWRVAGVTVARTGMTRDFYRGQAFSRMMGREIVRIVRPGGETLVPKRTVHLPLYSETRPASKQQWGMSIDQAVCTGCGACVVACQAENNVPVVGPDEVARGRRMHWLRVDRYFEEGTEDPEIYFQPLACVQCEEAPCELVCPTGATQHSDDGLNEMNYARCIGTRYCSNNCPYKVRRFNFFRYADDAPEIQRMHNPRVTTRGRGVMEKCTYCVQRIRSAEFDARATNSLIPDGAATPACQQACPTGAIVFGDIADPTTRVSRIKQDPRNYALLGELNTKPRTTHMADVRPERDRGTT